MQLLSHASASSGSVPGYMSGTDSHIIHASTHISQSFVCSVIFSLHCNSLLCLHFSEGPTQLWG
jgi:hypothetical protein